MKIPTNKVTAAGLLIALGIIYGDIGTSPLYVFNAIIGGRIVSEDLIVGTLSCIIWTLTLQTTIKYVILILRADNRGEGGTFALYALVRRRKKWLVIPAMIGGAALLADGIITPPISITSAIEGLKQLPSLGIEDGSDAVVIIVLSILALFFFMQQFGTASIGKLFGPIMFIWFTMLLLLGIIHVFDASPVVSTWMKIQVYIFSLYLSFIDDLFYGCRSIIQRLRPLRKKQYPILLDLRKNLFTDTLFRPGC